jgi:hypothetical protein
VSTGVHFRNGIACPTGGDGCTAVLRCTLENWADLMTGRATLSALVREATVSITGDEAATLAALRACDLEGLRS